MRPDVAALNKTFDYSVPEDWRGDRVDGQLRVGSRVRVDLQGRRVAGWVTELDPAPIASVKLSPLQKWSGHGPNAELIDLAGWAARRWAGSSSRFLRTASPPKNVYRLPPEASSRFDGEISPWVTKCFDGVGSVVRIPPAGDRWPVVLAAAALGNPLLLVPTIDLAIELTARLRRLGLRVALMPDDWAQAAAGAIVVGTRSAAFASVANVGAIVVFDEHDEAHREERTPTWHARDVAIERARRAGVPCVLVSPAPSLEALQLMPLVTVERTVEFGGWPHIQIVDRRDEPPGRLGLFSDEFVRSVGPATGRVACILNRTGRVRLLACVSCGELTTCEACGASVRQVDDADLSCTRCGAVRPPACVSCGGSRLKNLVLGVGRAREELAALLGEPVGEVTAGGSENEDARVVIGTEALLRAPLRRADRWRTVAFLDFDQHLTALRESAEVEAFGLLTMAARRVGPRTDGARVLVQTRLPQHRVLRAAHRADPGPLAAELAHQAEQMQWPPAVAQADVSGEGAPAFMASFGTPLGVEVLGPNDGVWRLRSTSIQVLTDALAEAERPSGRLRIAVI